MNLLIITGLSGAGKTSIVNCLEDLGFFCVDNLPVKMIPLFSKLISNDSEYEKVAVVSDIRGNLNFESLEKTLCELQKDDIDFKLLFIDCCDDELLKRYRFTRRKHPFVFDDRKTTVQAIEAERKIFEPIKKISHYYIDTSDLTLSECKNKIIDMFYDKRSQYMKIKVLSFGYKYSIPKDADFIFDVRFLPNPYYVDELKDLTGLDERVSGYVMNFKESFEFEKRLYSLVDFACFRYSAEGRSEIVIAFGCTGGHHRSVTFAERLCSHLCEEGYNASVSHKDIEK